MYNDIPSSKPLRRRTEADGDGYRANPASVAWADNKGKAEADVVSFRAIAYDLMQLSKSGGPVKVLSLPGPDWRWERQLELAFRDTHFQFSGVEAHPVVHARLLAYTDNMPERFSTSPAPSRVEEFLKQNRKTEYDLIYYDWMGTWATDKAGQVDSTLARNMLSVGGILMLTVAIPRGQPETLDVLKRYPTTLPCAFVDARSRNKFVTHPKVCGIPRWIADRAKLYGAEMTPQLIEVYYSQPSATGCAMPQMRLTMRRDK